MFAQAPAIQWTKTFGGSGDNIGNSVQQTVDGGYIITGFTNSFGAGGNDVWLIKTDADGDTIWTKTYGDTLNDSGNSVQQTIDGGYIIVGATGVSRGSSGQDVWLIKTDADGDTIWTKTYGNTFTDMGSSVQQTTDSGYVITGSTNWQFANPGLIHHDIWLIKTDANGDTLWTKIYEDTSGLLRGGNSVQQVSEGGYIITGVTNKTGTKPPVWWHTGDLWLVRTDVNGDTIWTKSFGRSDNNYYDVGNSVQPTSDGGYIIIGKTGDDYYGDSDIWLLKTNADGDTIWTRTFGDTNAYDWGYSVQQTSDGGYISAGIGSLPIFRTNASGDTLWTAKQYDLGGFIGKSAKQSSDGGFIITGSRDGYLWLIKIAPDITSIDETPHVTINEYQLHQNYPNPFNPATTIEFTLLKSGYVELKVYNILGGEVSTIVSKKLNQGTYSYSFDGRDLASGVYYYRLVTGDYRKVKKMILLK
jgi:outer membrane protein assembly factor BamB